METTQCPICGTDLAAGSDAEEWVVVGEIEDAMSADFARETMATYEIPAVVVSRSGYFGQIGLTLTAFYSGKQALFEVRVPAGHAEAAAELLDMTLGEKWHRKDS